MLAGEFTYAVGCNSRICPHPAGPIILHTLGAGGVIAIVVVVLVVVLAILIRSGWGDENRHRMG
jgi:fumarate reductase subunit D